MDVCKRIVSSRYGSSINIRRAASPLVRNEPNRNVACMVLKATAYDRCHLALCHDEFRGPRSGLCRSGGISNNNNALCS
ncbi:uncharacterized protein TNCV_1811281 [Trichonephila clavipes]|nr:uncharacterized protein TNCV_1811281 [Trichonephila clavipes]